MYNKNYIYKSKKLLFYYILHRYTERILYYWLAYIYVIMGFATYNKIAILFILHSIISDVCVNGNYYYNIIFV